MKNNSEQMRYDDILPCNASETNGGMARVEKQKNKSMLKNYQVFGEI